MQHTPSTQLPLPHSALAVHDEPFVALQRPGLLAKLHALPDAHAATTQQVPSVQNPLAHCVPSPQAAPSKTFGTHAPDEQKESAAQSAFVAQDELQVVAPHAYVLHFVDGCTQSPAPSQLPASVCTPLEHDALPQVVEPPGA